MQAQINCPKCSTSIDVNKVLFEKVSSEVGQQYETTIAKEREVLAAEKKKVEAAQKAVDVQVSAAVEQQLTEAKRAGGCLADGGGVGQKATAMHPTTNE